MTSEAVPDGMSPRITQATAPPLEKRGDLRSRTCMAWIWHILYIIYSLEVGVFLLFLPWLGIWDNNYLIYRFPAIQPIVANSFLKGGVLGLGIVNILIGIQEVVQFRRSLKAYFSR
jgi:hypothetical protein